MGKLSKHFKFAVNSATEHSEVNNKLLSIFNIGFERLQNKKRRQYK